MNDEIKDYIEITEIKDKQILLLDLLKQFHNICEENGLIYNIFGGTFLGAVRHKGFIPWDDDIDVTMPREDYDKFIDLMNTKYSDKYDLFAYPKKNYIYPYAKLGMKGTVLYEDVVKPKYNKLALNMDIFPNDGYPDNEKVFDKYNDYEQKIILCSYNIPYSKNPIKALYKFLRKILAKCVGVNKYLTKQIKIISKNKIANSELMICQAAGLGAKGKLETEKYFDRVLYDFENIKVWGIKDYDIQLTRQYGDYMTLPPEDKRECPHTYHLYISKEIFDKYLKG